MTMPSKQNEEKSNPLITVSVVSHGDSKKIMRLLESMRLFEKTNAIQVVLTDNLGYDLPEIDNSPWHSLQIIHNKRIWGFARNQNQAFQLAKGKFFCLLNPDVVFLQPVFVQMLQWIKMSQADIVAPLVVDSKAKIQDSFRDLPTPLEIILRRLPGYTFHSSTVETNKVIRPDWLSGLFLLMRKETYQKLKGMNEKYHFYFEDVEFCTRARLMELKLLVDTAVRIQHDAHHASRRNLIYLLWHIRSAIRFFTSPVYREALKHK
jgi:GT2 family glycosyltransferase